MDDAIIHLGTKGSPSPSSSVLQLGGQTILIDCGIGAARALVEADIKLTGFCRKVCHLDVEMAKFATEEHCVKDHGFRKLAPFERYHCCYSELLNVGPLSHPKAAPLAKFATEPQNVELMGEVSVSIS